MTEKGIDQKYGRAWQALGRAECEMGKVKRYLEGIAKQKVGPKFQHDRAVEQIKGLIATASGLCDEIKRLGKGEVR